MTYITHKKLNRLTYSRNGTEALLEMESETNDCDTGLTGNFVNNEDTKL